MQLMMQDTIVCNKEKKQSDGGTEEMYTENYQCEEVNSIDLEGVGETESETIEYPDANMEVVQSDSHQNTEDQAKLSILEKKELVELQRENIILRKEVEVLSKFYNQQNQLFEEKLKDDEKLLKFYTGKCSCNVYNFKMVVL